MNALAKKIEQSNSTDQIAEFVQHLSEVRLIIDIKDNPEAMRAFAKNVRQLVFKQGQSLITEGGTGNEMFFMRKGRVTIYKRTPEGDRFPVATLSAQNKAFFGEGAMLDDDPRSATIVADEDCDCLVLSRPDFDVFCQAHPEWALPVFRRIAQAVMARLRGANNDFIVLYKALIREIRGQ